MDEDLELKIEKYLEGTMTPKEILAFENKMDTDEALKNEVLLTEDLNLFLKNKHTVTKGDTGKENTQEEQEIRQNIKNAHNIFKENTEKSQKTQQKKGSSKVIYFITSIAAVLILFVAVYFSSNNSSNSELFASYYDTSDLPSFTTRSSDASMLSVASESYRVNDFDKALEQFEAYIKTSENIDPLTYVYTGMIYANTNELDKAINQLELLENSNSIDAERAYWFKAMVYLKFDDKKNAVKNLKILQSTNSNYKKTQTSDLLEQLD